ncbi:MAG TPA: FtsX-like permease family protein, partial [Desulfobulbus sp.]|nr:FtsX-like permease family protein [Desulfobulbus sp.]
SGKILLAHKMRTVLSLSGIVVGICAVITMVAIGRGTERQVISQLTSMGQNLLIVNSGQVKIIAGRARQTRTVTTLEAHDAERLMARARVINYAVPAQSKKLPVKYGNLTTRTTITGTTAAIVKVRNYHLQRGRFFDEDEDRGRRRVAVLGQTVATNLFGKANPLGEVVRLGRVPFTVIGVLAAKGLDINGADQDDLVIVPLHTALRRLFNLSYINTIYVQAASDRDMERAEAEVRTILRAAHHLHRGRADDFTIRNQASVIEAQRESSQTFTLLIGSIAAVSLLVGGIGILAVMLISVRERTREIGLRMAVGARKSDILVQFLGEALLLGCAGAIIGVGIGTAASAMIAWFARWPLVLPIDLIVLAFAATLGMAIVFGVYPAVKAAGLDPIKALQFE